MGLCYGRRGTQKLELLVIIVLIHGQLRSSAASDSFSGESCICTGNTITYTCTVLDNGFGATTWSGTAVDAAVIEYNCDSNVIDLAHGRFDDPEGTMVTCDGGTLVVQSVDVMISSPGSFGHTSEFIVRAFLGLNGTHIECSLSAGSRHVGSSSLIIAGPQSTPDSVSVDFDDPIMRQFSIRWNSGPNISCDPTKQYAVEISGPDNFCNPSGGLEFVDASTTEYQCSNWPPSSLGQTYTFRVAAINCENQTGDYSSPVRIDLQVPEAPTLTTCPVYTQSTGELLRIENSCTTVPTVTIANGVDGSPDAYIFSYNDVPQPPVPSGQCTNGTCTNVFTLTDPTVSQYAVSVTARNVVGEGPPDISRLINSTNDFVEVDLCSSSISNTVQCRFLGSFTDTAQCQIEYSTQEDLSGSTVDTGNSTSGDTVTVALTARLQGDTIYYYLVTATAEGMCVRLQGICETANCLVSELGEVDSAINGACPEGFVGSAQIPAGRACFNDTAPGSIAMYFCECEEQYMLQDFGGVCQSNRVCQSNGTWSGTIPDFERVTFELGRDLGVAAVVILYVPLWIIAFIIIVVLYFNVEVNVWHVILLIFSMAPLLLPSITLVLELLIWFNDKRQLEKKSLRKIMLISYYFGFGNFLWFASAVALILEVATFTQANGDCTSVTLLIVGIALSIGTLLWFLICLLILLYFVCKEPASGRRSGSYEVNASGSGASKKKNTIVELEGSSEVNQGPHQSSNKQTTL